MTSAGLGAGENPTFRVDYAWIELGPLANKEGTRTCQQTSVPGYTPR